MLNSRDNNLPLTITHSELVKEWNYKKNAPLMPEHITAGSNKKVWWICSKGHEWQVSLDKRTLRKQGCPYCSNHRVLYGFNDLTTVKPELAAEWHPTKNDTLKPTDITAGSNKKVWWQCSKGHEWQTSPNARTSKGTGCPFCSNKKVLPGFNDLATIDSELSKNWHPIKNGNLKPTDVTVSSGKRVWWQCQNGHEWQAVIANRKGCPFCSGRYPIKGQTDLATLYPEIAKEWHPSKNVSLDPTSTLPSTANKVWWKCNKGHEWQATLNSRTTLGCGCPYCSGLKPIKGQTDLATVNPELAKEWHPSRNGDLKPTDITASSNKKVWWKCNKGHEWQAVVGSRKKNGCPVCSKEMHTSFNEQAIFYYVHYYFNDAINGDKSVIGMELDVYVPSLKVAIEYDGSFWHKDKVENDRLKNAKCTQNGILLLRVQEKYDEQHDYNDCKCIALDDYSSYKCLSDAIVLLFNVIDNTLKVDVDVQRDKQHIWDQYIFNQKEKSVLTIFPEIATEWHPAKNGSLSPDKVSFSSNKKVWWKCDKGHEWQAVISSRTTNGKGCPYCSGRYPIKGQTDLASVNPELAREWHPVKNGNLTPFEIMPNSSQKVWWLGKCNHEWFTTVANRTDGCGCPYCSKPAREILVGFNDLATVNPKLAKEWHPTKNGDIKPSDVLPSSSKKVWWKCDKGHEWQASLNNRFSKNRGCPFCSNSKILAGYNDLATINPTLAQEWHPTMNGLLKPTDVTVSSGKKVWWQCSNGHSWEAIISNRSKGSGCPYCYRKR